MTILLFVSLLLLAIISFVYASIKYYDSVKRTCRCSTDSITAKKQRLANKYKGVQGVSNNGSSLDDRFVYVLTADELGM